MIKGVTHACLGPILYHSKISDVPYSQNQLLGWDFFCRFLQQSGSNTDELDWLSAMDLCMALINMYVSYRAQ